MHQFEGSRYEETKRTALRLVTNELPAPTQQAEFMNWLGA